MQNTILKREDLIECSPVILEDAIKTRKKKGNKPLYIRKQRIVYQSYRIWANNWIN